MNRRSGVLIVVSVVFIGLGILAQQKFSDRGTDDLQEPVRIIPEKLPDRTIVADIIGKSRPEFTLPDVAGNTRSISEWDGKVVAINFWATWCLPCLKEIPELLSLQSRYGEEGFQVIGIALQDPGELGDFIREQKMDYPVLAGEAPVITIAEEYGNLVGALPYTAIIDRTGTVVFTKAGPVTREEVEAIISNLL
jgi:peroxiredoxin